MRPLLTVCIFAYNHEKFIAQAIESVINQKTNFEFEIIVGEDGSTDKTTKILHRFQHSNSKKMQILIQDQSKKIYLNGRPTGKWNFINTLSHAKGKYISLLDGDDYWTDPLKLQKQVDFLEANPDYSICFHKVSIQNSDNGNIFESGLNPYTEPKTFSIKDLTTHNFIETVSVVFRNEGMDSLPEWFSKSPVGDYPLHILNARQGKIWFLPDNMAVYRHHATSYWSSQSSIQQKINLLITLDFLIQEFENDCEIKEGLIQQRFSYMNDIALEKLTDSDKDSFLTFFRECIKRYPDFSNYWVTHSFLQYKQEKEKLEQTLTMIRNSTTYRLLKKLKIFK